MDDQPTPQPPTDPFSAEAMHGLITSKNIEIAEAQNLRADSYNDAQVDMMHGKANIYTALGLLILVVAVLLFLAGVCALAAFVL